MVVTAVPGPTPTTAIDREKVQESQPQGTELGEKVYRLGIAEDLTTTNHWAYLGPDGTVWNGYVLSGSKPVLFTYSSQRFDWIPSLAADFPSPLKEEEVEGNTFWTTELAIKEGVKWSDGTEVSSEDFAFTAQTASELRLTGNWPSIVDPEYFDHAEAVGSYGLKIYFKQKPGLARWQFGLAFMPIFPKIYWEPVVEEARRAGDITEQQKALFAHVPQDEPSAGGFIFEKWENGAFAEKVRNPDYFFAGTEVTHSANGSYEASKPGCTSSAPTANQGVKRYSSTWRVPTPRVRSIRSTAARTPLFWPSKQATLTSCSIPLDCPRDCKNSSGEKMA